MDEIGYQLIRAKNNELESYHIVRDAQSKSMMRGKELICEMEPFHSLD